MANKDILERLEEGVVLGDGGYIIELEQRGWVVTGAFTPEISMTHPNAVRELHMEMKNAGCDVLQVMAFYGSREKLETVGYGDFTREINRAATDIAREVAGDEMLVAGNLSTTWMWEPDDERSDRMVAEMFDEQIEAQEGVDFVLGELFFSLGEALLCAERIKAKTSLPSMITMSFRATNVTEDGFTATECAKRLHEAGVDIIGLNCMRDPAHMYPLIREMRDAFDGYLAASPSASARQTRRLGSVVSRPSPTSWNRRSSPATSWATSPRELGTWGSTTSEAAAAASPPTCAKWRRCSASSRKYIAGTAGPFP